MDSIHIFNITLYCLTLLVTVSDYLFTMLQQRTDKPQNKLYLGLVTIVSLNALSLIGSSIMNSYKHSSEAAYLVMRLCKYLYFFVHPAIAPVFFLYVICVSGSTVLQKRSHKVMFLLPFIVSELMILANPLNHWVFTFENMEFKRSMGDNFIYVCGIFYLGISILFLFRSWDALTDKRQTALVYFFLVVALGTLIQFLFINIKVELFAEALALMGVMIAIESEDDRIDVDTGTYNRKALSADVNSYIVNKRSVYLICIKITNNDTIRKTTGTENGDILFDLVTGYLKTLFPKYDIYIANPSTFIAMLFDVSEDEAKSAAEMLSERFDKPWVYSDSEMILTAVIMAADIPGRITETADALYMADSPIPSGNDKRVLMGSDLDYLMRRSAVEAAINRGLEHHNFDVYYQPTYYIDAKRLHGAEALIRLHDDHMGDIYPDEFIPIAEQIGMIDALDNFVLEEVCLLLNRGIPQSFGMECINVNLSVVHCMQPDFVKGINYIIDKYGVDRNSINFEITESIAASDYKRLNRVVSEMKADGYHFSMDDYGTGYSNMQAIFSLDFDIVKIDKSILWSAEKSEFGRIILESSVNMIKQMHRQILVEGVETQKQIEMLRKLSVDYLQGYYFSKPVPQEKFIAIIKENHENNKGEEK